jgi:type IV pilus assembly protein PilP
MAAVRSRIVDCQRSHELWWRRVSVNVSAIALSVALVFLMGCEEERPQPSNDDFKAEREKLNNRVAERKASEDAKRSAPAAAPENTAHAKGPQYGRSSVAFTYEPTGKRDPFRSFLWKRLEIADDSRGPLEQFDVSQLDVVAVVWSTGNARAMIQDPSGMGHIVSVGARVGKNEGLITSINDNLIVVNETYEDYLGQVTKKDIELRIRRPGKGGVNVGVY